MPSSGNGWGFRPVITKTLEITVSPIDTVKSRLAHGDLTTLASFSLYRLSTPKTLEVRLRNALIRSTA